MRTLNTTAFVSCNNDNCIWSRDNICNSGVMYRNRFFALWKGYIKCLESPYTYSSSIHSMFNTGILYIMTHSTARWSSICNKVLSRFVIFAIISGLKHRVHPVHGGEECVSSLLYPQNYWHSCLMFLVSRVFLLLIVPLNSKLIVMVYLSHWGRVTHICVSELTIIGSDNGLSPGRRQAIIWNNAGLLLIEPLGTNFSEISIGIQTFSFKKMHLNMSSANWRPFCLGLNVLILTPEANYEVTFYTTHCLLQQWSKGLITSTKF